MSAISTEYFTYINEYGEEMNIVFGDIPYHLTLQLLEKNWNSYKYLLEVYTEYRNIYNINTDEIDKELNNTLCYDTWFSSHVQSLSYLVGDKNMEVMKNLVDSSSDSKWYGKNTSIPDKEGCEILDLMMKNGAKIDVPNYYDETILQSIASKRLTSRINNEMFVSKLKEYFSKL
tara:strand:+ start:624 stop:1145 length:522 start_codon:yes stop_codon:yes gene_type:complete